MDLLTSECTTHPCAQPLLGAGQLEPPGTPLHGVSTDLSDIVSFMLHLPKTLAELQVCLVMPFNRRSLCLQFSKSAIVMHQSHSPLSVLP